MRWQGYRQPKRPQPVLIAAVSGMSDTCGAATSKTSQTFTGSSKQAQFNVLYPSDGKSANRLAYAVPGSSTQQQSGSSKSFAEFDCSHVTRTGLSNALTRGSISHLESGIPRGASNDAEMAVSRTLEPDPVRTGVGTERSPSGTAFFSMRHAYPGPQTACLEMNG